MELCNITKMNLNQPTSSRTEKHVKYFYDKPSVVPYVKDTADALKKNVTNRTNNSNLNNYSIKKCDSPKRMKQKLHERCRMFDNNFDDVYNLERFCYKFDNMSLNLNSSLKDEWDFSGWKCCVPEHDRKIISRMAMKRARQLAEVDEAWLARRYWEREKEERDKLTSLHEAQYQEMLRARRAQGDDELWRRSQETLRQQQQHQSMLTARIGDKTARVEKKRHEQQVKKDLEAAQRKKEEMKRAAAVALAVQEQQVLDDIRRCEMAETLRTRMRQAESRRKENIQYYQKRVASANMVSAAHHRSGLQETRRRQESRDRRVVLEAARGDRRATLARQRRERQKEQGRIQARHTAGMREHIRRSLSPESTRRQIKSLKQWKKHQHYK